MGKIITIPFAALLRWIYAFTQSYGLSIILFALVIKLIMLPFQMKSKRSMIRMGRLSKKQEELKKQYARNQQKYNEELQKLYQEEGVNPMGGCLWSFLPLFIMIPLYSIIYRPITHFMGLSEEVMANLTEMATAMGYTVSNGKAAYEQIYLTNFISKNWDSFSHIDGVINVNFEFLGLDLSATPTAVFGEFAFQWACIGLLLIPILAAATQMISSFIMTKSNGQKMDGQMKTMNIMMPLMSLWICFSMPAAMGVYWIINSVYMAIQDLLVGKLYTKKIVAEEEERAAKVEASRKLRQEEAKKRALEQREMEKQKTVKKQQPKKAADKVSTNTEGRVGDRPYARGRSFQADRYENKE